MSVLQYEHGKDHCHVLFTTVTITVPSFCPLSLNQIYLVTSKHHVTKWQRWPQLCCWSCPGTEGEFKGLLGLIWLMLTIRIPSRHWKILLSTDEPKKYTLDIAIQANFVKVAREQLWHWKTSSTIWRRKSTASLQHLKEQVNRKALTHRSKPQIIKKRSRTSEIVHSDLFRPRQLLLLCHQWAPRGLCRMLDSRHGFPVLQCLWFPKTDVHFHFQCGALWSW